MGGSSLASYLGLLLGAVIQLAIYLFQIHTFEIDPLDMRSFMSGTYCTIATQSVAFCRSSPNTLRQACKGAELDSGVTDSPRAPAQVSKWVGLQK